MENQRAQLLERLQTANNILVTVSSNPSVDQLSAAIGLTLMLNRVGKQATAVFSGKVPSTIEFLQPEKTIERNTDSLRDFIIALDKSKADKLRYKVEDNHVKIFITPYRTALSEKDLQFSQGDFNIEVVVALGVKEQKDLDRAITAHGRILHDATTISVTNGEPSSLGSIDWDDAQASGLSEMVAGLASDLGPESLDAQVSTALLTGIVAQTERFRNARTQPATMSISSALMAAGANQQLIASKLEQQPAQPQKLASKPPKKDQQPEEQSEDKAPEEDASALRITHEEEVLPDTITFEEPAIETPVPEAPAEEVTPPSHVKNGRGALVLEPPTMGSKLTANTEPEHLDAAIDALGVKTDEAPLLSRKETPVENTVPADLPSLPVTDPIEPEPVVDFEPPVPTQDTTELLTPLQDDPAAPALEAPQTLDDLEAAVRGSYDEPTDQPIATTPEPVAPVTELQDILSESTEGVDTARDAVSEALASIGATEQPLPPIAALNAQPFDINDQLGTPMPQPDFTIPAPTVELPPELDQPAPAPEFTMPENLVPPAQPITDTTASVADPTAPPTVPPPFMPGVPGFGAPLPPIPPAQDGTNPQQPPAGNAGNPFNLPPA